MLNNHVISLRQIRRRDDHRKALLAQLSVQTQQLSNLPSLSNTEQIDLKQYSSYSTPIMMAARQKHIDTINDLKKPWWEKLDANNDVNKKTYLDCESQYLHDHEKLF